MSEIFCQTHRTCEKKKKTVVNYDSLASHKVKYNVFPCKSNQRKKAHIKYLNETIFKMSLAFGSFAFLHLFCARCDREISVEKWYSFMLLRSRTQTLQAPALLDTAGKGPRTVTSFIMKQPSILQMCSSQLVPEVCCDCSTDLRLSLYLKLLIKKKEKGSEPLISTSLPPRTNKIAWNKPEGKNVQLFSFYDFSYSKWYDNNLSTQTNKDSLDSNYSVSQSRLLWSLKTEVHQSNSFKVLL